MQRTSVRIGLRAASSLFLLALSAPGAAQPFYDAGEISVALERGFGIHHVSQNWEQDNGAESGNDATVIGIGWAGALTPLHYTRAAVDGFIMDQLSLGGSFGFFSQSGDADTSGLLIAPRVGYAIPLSDIFTFWPRGGLTFYDFGNQSLFALTGEAMFVASPHPNWGILFGPTIDLGFAGEQGDADYSAFAIGFPAVGLMGTF
jgi:hypothetical protein